MAPEQLREILKRLRRYEIQIRQVINQHMAGDYHSVFKGSGLDFDDVRAYQYGDEIRTIDWNVSAKGHGTFVKTFREEREQTLCFVVDVSASQEIGLEGQSKLDLAREVCGVLALSAIKEQANTSLIAFSDRRERYMRPDKGMRHGYQLIAALYDLVPKGTRTSISGMARYTLSVLKRRSVVILISDFIDEGYEPALRALAARHDLICLHIADRMERRFPRLGIVPLYDKERRRTVWVNTSAGWFSQELSGRLEGNRATLEELCRRNRASYLYLETGQDYAPALVKLFRLRRKRR